MSVSSLTEHELYDLSLQPEHTLRSDYVRTLEHWSIGVRLWIFYEDLLRNPADFLASVLQFIGADARWQSPALQRMSNVGEKSPPLSDYLRDRWKDRYAETVNGVLKRVGDAYQMNGTSDRHRARDADLTPEVIPGWEWSLLHQEQTMKAKRFSEEQIIGVLKEADAGAKTKDFAGRHGISEATFYNWKAKYAGMTVSEARRLKELEAENSKLSGLLAEAELDKAALKDLLGRKW